MPIYEYRCQDCGHYTDVLQKLSEDPLKLCPECQAPEGLRRLISAPAFRLKGGGWYETDFKSDKEKRRNLADGGDGSGKSDSGGASSSGGEAAASANGASKSSDGGSKSGDGGSKSGDAGSKSGDGGSKSKEGGSKPSEGSGRPGDKPSRPGNGSQSKAAV